MSSTPTVSIVIRSFNEERHIGRLLAGILRQSLSDPEILVVDSGSSDATLAIASRFPVQIVHVDPREFSFGRSLNRGFERASGDFIVLASAHVYPLYRDWLERVIAPFSDPKIAVVYGKQRGNEDTKYSERRIFEQWFPNTSKSPQDHPFCNNANAAIRREVWEEHPYDEEITGLEDLAFARAVMEQGHGIAYAAEAEVVHVHDEDAAQIYRRYMREAIALKRIFPHERFTTGDFLRLVVANTWNDWKAAQREGVLARHALEILRFRVLQLWGTRCGFAKHGPVTSQLKEKFYYPRRDAGEPGSPPSADEGRIIRYSA